MSSPRQPPTNATVRFSDRVADYVKARPGYPLEVIELLKNRIGLGPATVVADIGAGTGILTRLLLHTGATVHAIEPNEPMREALLATSPNDARLAASAGTAESTNLADASVELITAAQAFHWFDRDAARREFQRILRPGGWVALIWNGRQVDTSPFLVAYEQLLQRRATDYRTVNHRGITPTEIQAFFNPGAVERVTFPNAQHFDFEGLRRRLLSSSYAPAAGQPNHEPMLENLRAIFDEHQRNGVVVFAYETELHLGRL